MKILYRQLDYSKYYFLNNDESISWMEWIETGSSRVELPGWIPALLMECFHCFSQSL